MSDMNLVRVTIVAPKGKRLIIGARVVPEPWDESRELAEFAAASPGWGLLTMGYQEHHWHSARAELVRQMSVGEWA